MAARAGHPAWCVNPECAGSDHFSEPRQTPIGDVWVRTHLLGGVEVVVDTATLTPVMTRADLAVLQAELAVLAAEMED